jgi:hypothetical protein
VRRMHGLVSDERDHVQACRANKSADQRPIARGADGARADLRPRSSRESRRSFWSGSEARRFVAASGPVKSYAVRAIRVTPLSLSAVAASR